MIYVVSDRNVQINIKNWIVFHDWITSVEKQITILQYKVE